MTAVLVTGVGSTTGVSVVKALRQQSEIPIRIVGVDIHSPMEIAGSTFCDAFHSVPSARERDYIRELLRVCVEESVDVLFPIVDAELERIAPHREAFRARGVHVWISDPGTVSICNDKYLTYQFFSEHRFPIAKTWLPEEIAGREAEWTYPLVVKPTNGVSSRDVFRVENASELRAAVDRVSRPVVQEYLRGAEYTIDVVSDDDGRVLAVVPRERIEVKAGISFKGRTVRNEALMRRAAEIAQALQIRGACNIQCRVADGRPTFFEVNPRFSGTLPLTVAAGVNSPLLLVKLAHGERILPGQLDFRDGVYMARYWEEIFYCG